MFDRRGGWTAEAVGEALIAAFRARPGRPLYSDKRLEMFLSPAPRERGPGALLCLMVWARTYTATSAPSVAEFCRQSGLPRPTFERRRRSAAQAIADGLNRTAWLDNDKAALAPFGDVAAKGLAVGRGDGRRGKAQETPRYRGCPSLDGARAA